MDWWQQLIANSDLDQVPLAAVVLLIIILILNGKLSPVSVLIDIRKDRDAWKVAYLESEKARGVLVSQNGELLEVAKSANHILRSFGGGDGVAETTSPVRPGQDH
jgi:hypothetical protein